MGEKLFYIKKTFDYQLRKKIFFWVLPDFLEIPV